MHSLWIEWRERTLQTQALLALAGVHEQVEADAHEAFADTFTPSKPFRQDPEERRMLIARMAAM